MTLTKSDKNDIEKIVVNAINDVIIPAMDNLTKNVATNEDFKTLSQQIGSLERKFDAQQDRIDRHGSRIEKLEKIHPQSGHVAIT